jgi:hypothetical protein
VLATGEPHIIVRTGCIASPSTATIEALKGCTLSTNQLTLATFVILLRNKARDIRLVSWRSIPKLNEKELITPLREPLSAQQEAVQAQLTDSFITTMITYVTITLTQRTRVTMRTIITASEINGRFGIFRPGRRRLSTRRRATRWIDHLPIVCMVTSCSILFDKLELLMAFRIMSLTNELAAVSIHKEFKFASTTLKPWKFLFAIAFIAWLEFHDAVSILHAQASITFRTNPYFSISCVCIHPPLIFITRVTIINLDNRIGSARTTAFPAPLSFASLCLPL